MTAPKKRLLPWLPDWGTHAREPLRDWLTQALCHRAGDRILAFTRHGRQKSDGCELLLEQAGGARRAFDLGPQGGLQSPTSMKAALASASDGYLRLKAPSNAEKEDVWIALCSLAKVLVDQDDRDETHDWVAGHCKTAVIERDLTFEPEERFDTLEALKARPEFTRQAAHNLSDVTLRLKNSQLVRPTLIVDSVTDREWIRAGELATYVRHVVGAGPLSQSTLDGRMSAIGAERHALEEREGKAHPRIVLYLLPEDIESDPGQNGLIPASQRIPGYSAMGGGSVPPIARVTP